MNAKTTAKAVEMITGWLSDETPVAPETAAYLATTFGPMSRAQLGALLEIRQDSEAESAVELLLFPDRELRLRLEPLLADVPPEDAPEIEHAAVAGLTAKGAVLRRRLDLADIRLPLGEEDAALLLSRLRIGSSPPPELRAALDAAYPEAEALALRLALRDMRLSLSPTRIALLGRLIERHPREAALLAEAMDALSELLAGLSERPDDAVVFAALRRAYEETRTNLRRQVEHMRILAGSSFEILSAQGLRASYVHPETARQRMEALARVSLAVFGAPAWDLSSAPENVDLGDLSGAEGITELIRRMG